MAASSDICGKITINGLFADVRGNQASTPLLFLHGGPGQGCYEFMALQGDRLSAAVRLVGIDQRGVDRSAPLPAGTDLTIADVVDDCERVRQALDIDRWVVLGQSFGGILALRYATRYPDAVIAVIFENPCWDIALTTRNALPRIAAMLSALGRDEQSRAALDAAENDRSARELWAAYVAALAALGEAREEYFVPSPSTRTLLYNVRSARIGSEEPSESTTRHHLALLADETMYQSPLPLLSELEMPALLITGSLDPTTSPQQREAFGRSPALHKMEEFQHCGHFVHADQPVDYATAVIRFVRRQSREVAGHTEQVKYLLMIYGNREKWESLPTEAWPEAIAKQEAFNARYRDSGELLGSYGLADAAQVRLIRRVEGMPAVTDGPYLETKEYMASFWLLDCESQERAEQIAADMPFADTEPVELWPILHESAPEQ